MKRFSFHHDSSGDRSQPLIDAVATAHGFAADNMLPPGLATRLAIIVEELVANVVTHGAAAGFVTGEVLLELRDDGVLLVLEDNGVEFDPRSWPLPDGPHPVTGGGSGIPLVRAWAEIRDYRREKDRNRLDLLVRR